MTLLLELFAHFITLVNLPAAVGELIRGRGLRAFAEKMRRDKLSAVEVLMSVCAWLGLGLMIHLTLAD